MICFWFCVSVTILNLADIFVLNPIQPEDQLPLVIKAYNTNDIVEFFDWKFKVSIWSFSTIADNEFFYINTHLKHKLRLWCHSSIFCWNSQRFYIAFIIFYGNYFSLCTSLDNFDLIRVNLSCSYLTGAHYCSSHPIFTHLW